MNLLDVVLILVLVVSVVHGLRLGAVVQILSFGGFWLGLFLGALLAPHVARVVSNPWGKAALTLVVIFGLAALVGGLGRQLGVRAWTVLKRVKLAPADAGLGAVIAVVATLLVVWLTASILVSTPTTVLSSEIQGSAIVHGLDSVLPPAPSLFSRIQALINSEGFPQVFAQLPPPPAGPVTLPGQHQLDQAISRAGSSTVRIEGAACGQFLEGSGFVVAADLVVTNAHVVAGVDQPVVDDSSGRHQATTVLFDPSLDIAVLRTPTSLGEPVLAMAADRVGRGTEAAVLGYPGGGPFQAVPAGVLQSYVASGRDIYGQGLVNRYVYELEAVVRPGNSGGPLVEPDGTVIGVVFSRSSSNRDIGYALESADVLAKVRQAEASSSPVGTGACTSD
jgi:S1-C subfamily serine protease